MKHDLPTNALPHLRYADCATKGVRKPGGVRICVRFVLAFSQAELVVLAAHWPARTHFCYSPQDPCARGGKFAERVLQRNLTRFVRVLRERICISV